MSLPSTVGQVSGASATTATSACASAATASDAISASASGSRVSCSVPDVARESWNRSSTIAVIRVRLAADPAEVVAHLGGVAHHPVGQGVGHPADPGER